MTRPKRQHTTPEFYLEHFTDPDRMLWVFDSKNKRVRADNPANCAVVTNFYSPKREDGEYNDQLEKWLSGVESRAAGIYPKLLSGETLQGQERADFAVFVSSMFTRSPALIRACAEVYGYALQHVTKVTLRDRDRFEAAMDAMEADLGKSRSPEERDRAFDFMRDTSRYEVAVDRQIGLPAMAATDSLTPMFMDMAWTLFYSEEQHIITSDNPVVRVADPRADHPIFGGGFLNRSTKVTLPLNPSIVLELSWRQHGAEKMYEVNRERARIFNRQRAHFAEQYLFASKRDYGILALAQKYRKPGLQFSVSGQEKLAKVRVARKLRS